MSIIIEQYVSEITRIKTINQHGKLALWSARPCLGHTCVHGPEAQGLQVGQSEIVVVGRPAGGQHVSGDFGDLRRALRPGAAHGEQQRKH